MRIRCQALAAVFAAACGGSNPMGGGGGGGNNTPPPAATVGMSEYHFSPDTVRVHAGSIVEWSNAGTLQHTSTSDSANGWDSGALTPPQPQMSCPYPPCGNTPGATFQFKFMSAGTYPYHCAYHAAMGMKGVVIVSP